VQLSYNKIDPICSNGREKKKQDCSSAHAAKLNRQVFMKKDTDEGIQTIEKKKNVEKKI